MCLFFRLTRNIVTVRSIVVVATIFASLVLFFIIASPAYAGRRVNLLSYTKHNGTDDQVGIMNAFQAAGPGGSVTAPAGFTWLHSGQLVAPPGMSLIGGGPSAIFKATNNSSGALVLSGSGSWVYNLTIEYASPSNSAPPTVPYPDPNLDGSGIVIQSATNVSILQVNIPATSDNSVAVVGSNSIAISNSQLGSGFNSGVLIANSFGVQVIGNTFTAQIVNIVSGSYCVINGNKFINTGGAVTTTTQVANSQFNNNVIQNGSLPAYADFSLSGTVSNVQISGNTMAMVSGSTIQENTLWTQAIFILNLGSVNNLNGVTISNNTINGGCSSRAIYVSGAGTNVIINGNTFTNIGTNCLNSSTIPGYGAIDFSSCSGKICGNTFNTVNAFAIAVTASPYVSAPPVTVQIANNTGSNCYMYQFPSFFLNNPAFNVAVIVVTAGNYKAVSIDNNTYTGGGHPGFFVDCSQLGAEQHGNNGGTLPSYYAP